MQRETIPIMRKEMNSKKNVIDKFLNLFGFYLSSKSYLRDKTILSRQNQNNNNKLVEESLNKTIKTISRGSKKWKWNNCKTSKITKEILHVIQITVHLVPSQSKVVQSIIVETETNTKVDGRSNRSNDINETRVLKLGHNIVKKMQRDRKYLLKLL